MLRTEPAPLNATATSGLEVSFASTTPDVCAASGTTLTLLTAGTCTVQALQGGSANYSAVVPEVHSFEVEAALLAQGIDFPSPGNQTLGTAPPALLTTATSNLQVSFSSTTTGVCTVSDTTFTLLAVGTCTIIVSQAGNATYAEPVTVSRTFSVAAAAMVSATMLQNSIEQGARPPLVEGASLTLKFWVKGTAGATGNVLFALRYLDGVDRIRADSKNVFFQNEINTTTWTEITYNLGPVPAGATAALIEFAQNIGPVGLGPAGEDWFGGEVFIDDLSLQ